MPSKVSSNPRTKKTGAKKKNKENHETSNVSGVGVGGGGSEGGKKKSSGGGSGGGQLRHKKKLHSTSMNISNMNQSLNATNRLITDYFQIRKSSRRCKSDIERERREHVERAIKEQIEEGLEVKVMELKGRGVFATRRFERGEFVCEYAGEMISYKLAKKREEMYSRDASIGCYMYFFEHKSKQYCIDATAETERLGRLFNHSKLEGNCHTKLFEMNSRPYLILVASRNIELGEELMYDYGERNQQAIESHPWLAT